MGSYLFTLLTRSTFLVIQFWYRL